LTLGVGEGSVGLGECFVVFGDGLADAEVSGYAEAETADYGTGSEIGELVGMVADVLSRSVVAIYKSGVGFPGVGGLIL